MRIIFLNILYELIISYIYFVIFVLIVYIYILMIIMVITDFCELKLLGLIYLIICCFREIKKSIHLTRVKVTSKMYIRK